MSNTGSVIPQTIPFVVGAPDPVTVTLEAALERLLATSTAPKYLRDAATPWLALQP